jgi:hypothetical protein
MSFYRKIIIIGLVCGLLNIHLVGHEPANCHPLHENLTNLLIEKDGLQKRITTLTEECNILQQRVINNPEPSWLKKHFYLTHGIALCAIPTFSVVVAITVIILFGRPMTDEDFDRERR